MPSKYTIWHYAVSNFGGVHELNASALSLICSIVTSQWLRNAKSTLGCLMWVYFCIVLFIRLLLPEQAHCPIQTSVNNSSVICGRLTLGLLGNYSLFFLCSKLSLSFFLCILLPLFYVLCSPLLPFFFQYLVSLFSYFLIPYPFFHFLTRFSLSCFFPVHVPPFAFLFSYSFLSSVFYPILSFFLFYSCLTFFISRLLYLRLASTVELHLSGLIGTASHPDSWIFLWK
jgi:hypothetical protein